MGLAELTGMVPRHWFIASSQDQQSAQVGVPVWSPPGLNRVGSKPRGAAVDVLAETMAASVTWAWAKARVGARYWL